MGCLGCQGDSIYTFYTGSDRGKLLISQENGLKKRIAAQSLRGERVGVRGRIMGEGNLFIDPGNISLCIESKIYDFSRAAIRRTYLPSGAGVDSGRVLAGFSLSPKYDTYIWRRRDKTESGRKSCPLHWKNGLKNRCHKPSRLESTGAMAPKRRRPGLWKSE